VASDRKLNSPELRGASFRRAFLRIWVVYGHPSPSYWALVPCKLFYSGLSPLDKCVPAQRGHRRRPVTASRNRTDTIASRRRRRPPPQPGTDTCPHRFHAYPSYSLFLFVGSPSRCFWTLDRLRGSWLLAKLGIRSHCLLAPFSLRRLIGAKKPFAG
jgi:hypothetical protein